MQDESLYFSSVGVKETPAEVNETPAEKVQKNSVISTETVSSDERVPQMVQKGATEPQVAALKPKRELPKRSAMSALLNEIHKEEVEEQDLNKVELTAANLQGIWGDFLKENKDKLQNAFLSAAQHQVPVLIEDRVTFTASNNVSLEMLQLHKMDITTYFRKRTTSTTVVPDFILNREETQAKNYKTAKDRLKDMIDANAAVLKLIEKFDLNID